MNAWKFRILLSQDEKKLSKWNKQFSLFQNCSFLNIKQNSKNLASRTFKNMFILFVTNFFTGEGTIKLIKSAKCHCVTLMARYTCKTMDMMDWLLVIMLGVHLNWLNWFHFLFLEWGLLVILIDCISFLSPLLDVTRMPMSRVSFTARLWNSLPIECFPSTYDLSGFKSRINRHLLLVASY